MGMIIPTYPEGQGYEFCSPRNPISSDDMLLMMMCVDLHEFLQTRSDHALAYAVRVGLAEVRLTDEGRIFLDELQRRYQSP